MKILFLLIIMGNFCLLATAQETNLIQRYPLYFCQGETAYSTLTAFYVGNNFFLIPHKALNEFIALPYILKKTFKEPSDTFTIILQKPSLFLNDTENTINFTKINLNFSISPQACNCFVDDATILCQTESGTYTIRYKVSSLENPKTIPIAASVLQLATYLHYAPLQKIYIENFAQKLQEKSLPENYILAQQLEDCWQNPEIAKPIIKYFDLANRLNSYWLTQTNSISQWRIKIKKPFSFKGWSRHANELLFTTPHACYCYDIDEWHGNSMIKLEMLSNSQEFTTAIMPIKENSNADLSRNIVLSPRALPHYRTILTTQPLPCNAATFSSDGAYLAVFSAPDCLNLWYLRNSTIYKECSSNTLSLTTATLFAAFCKAQEKAEPWEINFFKKNDSLFRDLVSNQNLLKQWLKKS